MLQLNSVMDEIDLAAKGRATQDPDKPRRNKRLTEVKSFNWNKAGLVRLGKLIEATLNHNRFLNRQDGLTNRDEGRRIESLRMLAEECGLKHPTLSHLVNGGTQSPRSSILQLIAPHIYRVQYFEVLNGEVKNTVMDTSQTYRDDWESFARIGTIGTALDKALGSSRKSQNSFGGLMEDLIDPDYLRSLDSQELSRYMRQLVEAFSIGMDLFEQQVLSSKEEEEDIERLPEILARFLESSSQTPKSLGTLIKVMTGSSIQEDRIEELLNYSPEIARENPLTEAEFSALIKIFEAFQFECDEGWLRSAVEFR